MKIRLSGIVSESIVDGLGIRMTIFTQGCLHHCPHCHNPQTHDVMGGYETDTEIILKNLDENPLLDGITLSGGEPFLQPKACAHLARNSHQKGLTVWTYTGYTWETLLQQNNPDIQELIQLTDILVDGPFQKEHSSYTLQFKGSANQRIIDVKKTLQTGHVYEYPLK